MNEYEFVVCQICGKKCRQLTQAHLNQHGIRLSVYKEQFPEAILVCQAMRDNQKNKMKAFYVAHPEKIEEHKHKLAVWNTLPENKEKLRTAARNRPPQTTEKKQRISHTMKKRYAEIADFPLKLKNEDQTGEKNHFYNKTHSPETIQVIRQKTTNTVKKAYADGSKISPWKYLGNGKNPSAYEQATIDSISELGFIYNHALPFPKGAYYIDFAHKEKKIAIELDTQLHNTKYQQQVDNRKDVFMRQHKWKVYRIYFEPDLYTPAELAINVRKIVEEILQTS